MSYSPVISYMMDRLSGLISLSMGEEAPGSPFEEHFGQQAPAAQLTGAQAPAGELASLRLHSSAERRGTGHQSAPRRTPGARR